jgi:hypothetical protein
MRWKQYPPCCTLILQANLDPIFQSVSQPMNDISRLFQAFVAPAIFISATSLLILSINVRLMGIVSRLRQFVHAKHDATKNGRSQEAEAYTAQIRSIEQRGDYPAMLPAGPDFARGNDPFQPVVGFRFVLEGSRGGGGNRLCCGYDLSAGGNFVLHPRSDSGAEFGTERSTGLALYGPGNAGRNPGTPARCN